MTYDFQTRLDTLGSRMKEVNQNSIVYSRTTEGVTTSIDIENVSVAGCDVQQFGESGLVLITEKLQDFIFDTTNLSSLSPATPKTQDKIDWGSKIFEVLSIGEEVFKYTTSSRIRIRVHSKQVA